MLKAYKDGCGWALYESAYAYTVTTDKHFPLIMKQPIPTGRLTKKCFMALQDATYVVSNVYYSSETPAYALLEESPNTVDAGTSSSCSHQDQHKS